MEKGKLINRLICGEVGSGKTEVSMVVIFMMLNFFPRSQIAFLCPTSVLCRQHFLNFKSRFANFGFSVVELSSFNSHKENRRIKKMIHQGEYNIIIGTHAMLNSSKIFADLKMLVIDEEQCFGLQQKMLLSSLYPKIHVISLSATPIPRTLHMAMNGVHDISIIKEKPSKSSTITTQVIQYTEDLIKFYVDREINKGGQVFYVTPKISGLSNLHDRIINLFPDLKLLNYMVKCLTKISLVLCQIFMITKFIFYYQLPL
jgi:transcription-repair coupling factor (superfamily II helicase)